MSIELLNDNYEKVDYLCNLLTDFSTGGEAPDDEYKELRSELLKDNEIANLLPSWLKTNRNLGSFWGFIKGKFGTYAERRTFLSEEFSTVLNYLEFGIQPKAEQNNISTPVQSQNTTVKNTVIPKNKIQTEKTKVFIVHGHDNETKEKVARFIESIGLEAIILHEKASSGMTIIEKIEHYSNQSDFAIVLYTPCDKGRGAKETNVHPRDRARQNVVFEHGYLMSRLGRKNVCALVKGEIETPNDISGVVYISLDITDAWKIEVSKELKACGYNILSIV